MSEKVNTGGNISFAYPKGYTPKRDEELENKIDSSWERYYAKRMRNRIIFISVLVLLILVGLLLYFLIF